MTLCIVLVPTDLAESYKTRPVALRFLDSVINDTVYVIIIIIYAFYPLWYL